MTAAARLAATASRPFSCHLVHPLFGAQLLAQTGTKLAQIGTNWHKLQDKRIAKLHKVTSDFFER
jgi:hypothetical protein